LNTGINTEIFASVTMLPKVSCVVMRFYALRSFGIWFNAINKCSGGDMVCIHLWLARADA
jgi:hypothetical protein